METPQTHHGDSIEAPWGNDDGTMGTPRKHHGPIMDTLQKHVGPTMIHRIHHRLTMDSPSKRACTHHGTCMDAPWAPHGPTMRA